MDENEPNQCTNDQNESIGPTNDNAGPTTTVTGPSASSQSNSNGVSGQANLGSVSDSTGASATAPAASGQAGTNGVYGQANLGTLNQTAGPTTLQVQGPNASGGAAMDGNGGGKIGAQANLGGVVLGYNGENVQVKGGLNAGVGVEARANMGPNSCGFGMDVGPVTFDINSNRPCPTAKEEWKSPAGLRRGG